MFNVYLKKKKKGNLLPSDEIPSRNLYLPKVNFMALKVSFPIMEKKEEDGKNCGVMQTRRLIKVAVRMTRPFLFQKIAGDIEEKNWLSGWKVL